MCRLVLLFSRYGVRAANNALNGVERYCSPTELLGINWCADRHLCLWRRLDFDIALNHIPQNVSVLILLFNEHYLRNGAWVAIYNWKTLPLVVKWYDGESFCKYGDGFEKPRLARNLLCWYLLSLSMCSIHTSKSEIWSRNDSKIMTTELAPLLSGEGRRILG